MKEQSEHFEEFRIIESLKTKDPIIFLKSLVEILDKTEIEKLKGFIKDEDLQEDLLVLSTVFIKNFKTESIPKFLLNFETNLGKSEIPKFKNEKSVSEFLFFLSEIFQKETMPRQKLIQKKSIVDDFEVDPDTLNEWLLFFGKEQYLGRRDFNGLEWAEIVGDFIKVGNLQLEDLSPYHFKSYNKITIAKIIGNLSKGDKTHYRNLGLQTDEIDDLNLENKKFLRWLDKHHKLPFSLAYRYISLLLGNDNQNISVQKVFADYMSKEKN